MRADALSPGFGENWNRGSQRRGARYAFHEIQRGEDRRSYASATAYFPDIMCRDTRTHDQIRAKGRGKVVQGYDVPFFFLTSRLSRNRF